MAGPVSLAVRVYGRVDRPLRQFFEGTLTKTSLISMSGKTIPSDCGFADSEPDITDQGLVPPNPQLPKSRIKEPSMKTTSVRSQGPVLL
jgi:hypothetical protein